MGAPESDTPWEVGLTLYLYSVLDCTLTRTLVVSCDCLLIDVACCHDY